MQASIIDTGIDTVNLSEEKRCPPVNAYHVMSYSIPMQAVIIGTVIDTVNPSERRSCANLVDIDTVNLSEGRSCTHLVEALA